MQINLRIHKLSDYILALQAAITCNLVLGFGAGFGLLMTLTRFTGSRSST